MVRTTARLVGPFYRRYDRQAQIVEEELDESIYWMEIVQETGIDRSARLEELKAEAHELLAIFVASIKTLRAKSTKGRESG
ncbi:MAG: four helix bundle protein [Fimbriimonadaceae bacterium]|nr:four helix bundle protein [Fimbriimonadaceae bacterium]